MKKLWAAVLALVLLCGCTPKGKEPEGMELIRVLGVEGSSPVTLTAVCGSREGQPPARGRCVEETFLLGLEALPWSGERELSPVGISRLVVSRDADLTAVLFAVMEEKSLAPSMTLWLAEEGAAALLEGCEDPEGALELLEARGIRGPSAGTALGRLLAEGSVLLPVIGLREGHLVTVGEERRYWQ